MAEERTLGLARTREDFAEEPSKEELQRRLDETRDSISQTVTEIKETVANQVQAVKDTLDWREQFKKRPVAWSAGAAGVGFLVGYCVAATVKGDGRDTEVLDYYAPRAKAYASQPTVNAAQPAKENGNGHSFLDKLSHTPAYGRVKEEVGNVGDAFVQELGNTAKKVLLPALITSLTNFIGGHLRSHSTESSNAAKSNESTNSGIDNSSYQPQVGH